MHYILQASAFVRLWAALDRGDDGWTEYDQDEFENNLLNALVSGKLVSTSRLGLEITPTEGQRLDELYVTLKNCANWINSSSFQGAPADEFELASMLGLDVIIDRCQYPELQTRTLTSGLNAVINDKEFEFIVEQRHTPRCEEFELQARRIREIFETPDGPLRLNSAEYREFLNFTPAFVIQMKHMNSKEQSKAGVNPDLLATPQELVQAFGRFAGFDRSWFKDLSSKSKSFQASRKRKGTQGRNAIQPLFCPYEFMKALLEHRVQSRRRMSELTAWKALRRHFSDVYELHKAEAPSELEDR